MNTENGNPVPDGSVFHNRTDPAANRSVQEGAQRLREAIEAAGGQTRVSRRAGVPLTTLNRLLAGQEMKQSALVALADACRVQIEWLATGRGPRHAETYSAAPGEYPAAGEALPDGTTVAQGPVMPLPERPRRGLFATVDIDRFATAIERALKLYEDKGKRPSARGLSQVLLILYDDLTREAETSAPESHTDD